MSGTPVKDVTETYGIADIGALDECLTQQQLAVAQRVSLAGHEKSKFLHEFKVNAHIGCEDDPRKHFSERLPIRPIEQTAETMAAYDLDQD